MFLSQAVRQWKRITIKDGSGKFNPDRIRLLFDDLAIRVGV
jgi:hypothetical protein